MSGKKITYITAGAGGMYCGSCIRDNALAGALQDLGWDVTLLPLYTPIRTDDENRSVDQVFFGGINVYLQQKVPLFRHLPNFLDRWLDNPRLIRRVASGSLSVDARQLGAMTLSMVRGEDGHQRREVRKLLHWLKEEARPDLICLTNLLVGGSIPAWKRELGIPVLVTLQGDDIFLEELTEPWRTKVLAAMRNLARQADGFITFSRFYRDRMAALLDIPAERFFLTPLGINTRDFDGVVRKRQGKPVGKVIGYFARVCPEKGFDLLVSAFLQLATRDAEWTLVAGGWLSERDKPYFAAQERRIREAGLAHRFTWLGSPDQEGKLAFYEKIDVFCVPARFLEPKGLYALEAMACGVPVAAPDRGSFPEMIQASGGGQLFDSENVEQIAATLERLDPAAGARGRAWVLEHGCGEAMARATGEIFARVLGQSSNLSA